VIRVANLTIEVGKIHVVFFNDLGKVPNPR